MQAAVSQLVPVLFHGMRNNISGDSGLKSLMQALQTGGHQKYLDQLESLTDTRTVMDGNGVLGHILGSKGVSRAVADRVGADTGLDSGLPRQMLPLVGSMIIGPSASRPSAGGFPGRKDKV